MIIRTALELNETISLASGKHDMPGNQQICDKHLTVSTSHKGGVKILLIEADFCVVLGFGEKFDRLNQKGKHVITKVEEKFCRQGNISYCVTPFFFTESGFGVYIDTRKITEFDIQDRITCKMPEEAKIYFFSGTPKEILADYISLLGDPRVPPKYAFGLWISANRWNSQQMTENQTALIKQHNFPATVLVLEAWSDEATFYIFNGAKYTPVSDENRLNYEDFDFSESKYWDNPKEMIAKLHEQGIRLVLWQIPVYKKQEEDEIPNKQNNLDRAYAEKNGLCVKYADGTPYQIPTDKWFGKSYVPDFTNPDTIKSWFSKRQYLLDIGVDGFKTDGGEFIHSTDTVFSSGLTGEDEINQYSQDYLNAYTKFIGKENVLFSRAGYAGAHTTPIHWAGDHQSTNEELKAILAAGLSSAMSGISYWSFDIGGFAGPLPSPDLYLRSTQMGCFCPVMQWHSEPEGGQFRELMLGETGNNERSPWNIASLCHSPAYLDEIRYWHWLRMNLLPYIYSEAISSQKTRQPMMRPLIYEWPGDKTAAGFDDQYLFGETLLVAPLLEENQITRNVYFPDGIWYGLFSEKVYIGGQNLDIFSEKYPVFLRSGFALPLETPDNTLLGLPMNKNTHLHFLLAGGSGEYIFYPDETKKISVSWNCEEINFSDWDWVKQEHVTWKVIGSKNL